MILRLRQKQWDKDGMKGWCYNFRQKFRLGHEDNTSVDRTSGAGLEWDMVNGCNEGIKHYIKPKSVFVLDMWRYCS
jgi:hypothetical protein